MTRVPIHGKQSAFDKELSAFDDEDVDVCKKGTVVNFNQLT